MERIDIVIIGAGIAGIASAYYLQKNFPNIRLKILESRSSVGGTWDQMRFPGVRADNDMYTYGFSFDPWKGSIIGNGKEIKNYLNKVTDKFNIKKNILFDTEVRSLSWKDNKWVIKTDLKKFVSQYIICCTGSRDRKNPHLPKFKNEKIYQGKIIHTQAWGNTDIKDKNVTIVGSGCTAITMAPSIIKEAKKVTLVQRSPAWIINIDSKEKSTRIRKTFKVLWDYFSSRIFKKFQRKKMISGNTYYNETTTPSYDYWDPPVGAVACTALRRPTQGIDSRARRTVHQTIPRT